MLAIELDITKNYCIYIQESVALQILDFFQTHPVDLQKEWYAFKSYHCYAILIQNLAFMTIQILQLQMHFLNFFKRKSYDFENNQDIKSCQQIKIAKY